LIPGNLPPTIAHQRVTIYTALKKDCIARRIVCIIGTFKYHITVFEQF